MRKYIYLVIIIVVVGLAFFLNRGDQASDDASSNPSSTKNINVSNMRDNVNSQLADLEAVDGSDSLGTGFRYIKDGSLLHSVVATMPDPAEGSSYEGWLVQTNPLEFFSTGVMSKADDGTWMLEYTGDEEYPTYLRVVITEETVIDATPEKHIIEGDFKEN